MMEFVAFGIYLGSPNHRTALRVQSILIPIYGLSGL